MAAAVKTQYATDAVYGSVAYDLDKVPGYGVPQGEVRELPTPEELARERLEKRTRERARAREEAKTRTFGIPITAIIGGLAAAALLVFVLLGYIQLAALSGETSSLRSSISKLQKENEAIEMEYESAFDLDDIEIYAVNILGMVRPDSENQTTYTVIADDRAEVLAEDETAGLLARITGYFKALSEYFG